MTFGNVLSGREMAVVDANAAALGVSQRQLMESAANAIARTAQDFVEPGDRIEIVAGPGNNGGDAFAAARFLDEYDVRVTLLGRAELIRTDLARSNWRVLQRAGIDTRTVGDSTGFDLDHPDLIVDGMLGTGISGDLREPMATAARHLSDAEVPVLSVDVPSGLDGSTGRLATNAVEADRVVTFHKPKPGLADLEVTVDVVDIGIPPGAERYVERGDLLRLDRPADSHKGEFGEVLIVGGGPYTGAPALAAQSALRAGADLVRVACPAAIAENVQSYSENLIVRPFAGDRLVPDVVESLLELAGEHDSVVFGPGLGQAEQTLAAARRFLSEFEGRAVIDADPLGIVPDVETDATLVCTPHRGEVARMGVTEDELSPEVVSEGAASLGVTLLVKGPDDVIADGTQTRINRTGNPGMTVGGTGDVLAGVTGAVLATLDPHPAASIAAYVTGRAGDLENEEHGYGLVATDLLESVPTAMWDERP